MEPVLSGVEASHFKMQHNHYPATPSYISACANLCFCPEGLKAEFQFSKSLQSFSSMALLAWMTCPDLDLFFCFSTTSLYRQISHGMVMPLYTTRLQPLKICDFGWASFLPLSKKLAWPVQLVQQAQSKEQRGRTNISKGLQIIQRSQMQHPELANLTPVPSLMLPGLGPHSAIDKIKLHQLVQHHVMLQYLPILLSW